MSNYENDSQKLHKTITEIVAETEKLKDLNEVYSSANRLFDEKINELRKENKDFYKDFEATLRIKLDDNKSEIKRLIEDERSRLKEIFYSKIEEQTRQLCAQFKKQILCIIGVGACIVTVLLILNIL